MKTKEKFRSIMSKVIIILATIIIFNFTKVFASSELKTIEKSAEFEKWENLTEEERKTAIQPAYSDLSIEDSLKKSTYNELRSVGDSQLENRFFLSNNILKNQQKTGLCWAFSFTSSLESTISKKYNKTSLEYSPIYTDYVVSRNFRKLIGAGGNSSIAIASAISGYGSAYETDMPFSNYYNEENNPKESYYLSYDNVDLSNLEAKVKINETTRFASIYKEYETDNSVTYKDSSNFIGAETYTEEEVNAIRTQIKKHIKENGAVMGYTYTGNINNDYNLETNAFYSESIMSPDHAITIVGWDDNYSKENFASGNQPANDGAYIVLNSWGDEFGDSGYYYISYDDAYIEQEIQGIDDIQEYTEEEKEYDNLYQYDELGQSISYYFLNDKGTNYLSEGYLANVFTRESNDKYEYITEVGIYVPITEGIEIYVDYINSDIKDYELVASYTGTNALEPGYHSLKLASPLKIEGDSFAVIVKYINANGAEYSVECNYNSSGISEKENYYSTATANEGESYISNDGNTWTDINGYQIQGQGITYKDTNACIKAFTILSDTLIEIPVTGVKLNNNTISIEEGSSATLVETVEPSYATNKNVIWSSSDEEVATVKGGVVTANKVGEAVITVTTVDGTKTANCKVTVTQKEPETVSVQSVSLNITEISLSVGKTERLIETIQPDTATNKNVTWSSSNDDVATVSGGVVTAKGVGEATITVTTEDGAKTATCKITITEGQTNIIPVEKITLDKTEKTIQVGDITNLIVSFTPSNATNKNIKWESSDTNVATITKTGIITAVSEGKTTIKAISGDGNKEATCELTVVKKTNTDDDIYKGTTSSKSDDTTVAKKEFPDAGIKITFIVILLVTMIFVVIKFVKYRDLKDIK